MNGVEPIDSKEALETDKRIYLDLKLDKLTHNIRWPLYSVAETVTIQRIKLLITDCMKEISRKTDILKPTR